MIHLAALQIPFCRTDPALGAAVNVLGTVNAVRGGQGPSRADLGADRVRELGGAVTGHPMPSVRHATKAPTPTRSTHYGVYKQANEGNARIYWQDEQLPSLGLRPYNVYGPARDQGVTAEPTHAMAAAARGEGYHIDYGGRLMFNYTADVARALVAMSRSGYEGASVFNMPGSLAHMRDMVSAIEAAAPAVAGKITFADTPLPLPEELATGGLAEVVGPVKVTPLADAVRETVEHFRRHGATN